MRCLSQEQLARVSLGLSNPLDLSEHLKECVRCRAGLQRMRSLVRQLAEDYARLDRGHEEARDRLLAVIATRSQRPDPAKPSSFTSNWMEGWIMKRRVLVGGVGATIVLASALLWLGTDANPASAMGQVAETIRRAKSYQFSMTVEERQVRGPGVTGSETSRYSWLAPGSLRIETKGGPLMPGGMDRAEIMPVDQPGIEIDHAKKQYHRRAARLGHISPLMMLERMGTFSGQADRVLGKKVIGGKEAKGFAIDARKIDPDVYPGPVEVWVDALSNLPVLIRYEAKEEAGDTSVLRMDGFRWDLDLEPKLFDPTPPEGYAEVKESPTPLDEQVDAITKALRIFAEFSGGHYPRVKMVYGDVTRDELIRLAGVKWPPKPVQLADKKVGKIYEALRGFGWINSILRDNTDASYHGKTIGPNDKNKVLLRWKLDDNRYEVIFGDLRSETVTPGRLRALEGN